jgi:hypothetical protein
MRGVLNKPSNFIHHLFLIVRLTAIGKYSARQLWAGFVGDAKSQLRSFIGPRHQQDNYLRVSNFNTLMERLEPLIGFSRSVACKFVSGIATGLAALIELEYAVWLSDQVLVGT